MHKLTPYAVLVFAIGALLCGFLFWHGATDTVKLGGAIGAVLVAFLPALLSPPPGGNGPPPPVLPLVLLALLGFSACKPARTALQIAEVACVVANAALGDADVARVCSIANDAFEPMKEVLAGARQAGAQACAKDGGR